MKCRNCGAEIDLLDKVCPHCGSVNGESSGHQAEMKNYQKRSARAKAKVKESAARNVPVVVSAVILVFLIIGIGVASYVAEEASMFSHWAKRRESLKKHEEYSKIMLTYLEQGDYLGFVAFKEYHVVPEYEPEYQEFEVVWDVAYEYCKAMNSIEEAVMFGADSPRYRMGSYVFSCSSNIPFFYQEYGWKQSDIENDKYKKYIVDMKEQVDTAVRIYLGLDEEGLKEFLESSMNQQKAYLEEVLVGE